MNIEFQRAFGETACKPLLCFCSWLCFSFLSQTTPAQDLPAQVPRSDLDAARALESALVQAIEKAEQSVVAIARGRRGEGTRLQDPKFIPREYSAGVIVDEAGLILTNYHSLGKVDENDYVVWHQKRSFHNVRVRAADPWTDLAILEIKAKHLKPIEMGNAAGLKKGRIVIALGNPYAVARDGDVSATWGIVSNLHRKVEGPLLGMNGPDTVDPRRRETLYHYGGLIQTDAKLAKNTSGGPLLDLDGKMIGLSTSIAMLAGFEKGTGYAIPVDDRFLRVLPKLKRGEEIENGFLGVGPRNPDTSLGEVGVILDRVQPGTPAALAGLSAFDEVVQIDDQEIRTIDDLFFKVGSTPPGQTIQVTIRDQRGLFPSRKVTKQVQLSKKPHTASRPILATQQKQQWRGASIDYGTALSLNKLDQLDPGGCVIATDVQIDSAAWQAGIRVGTIISQVDGHAVTTPEAFFTRVSQNQADVTLLLFDHANPREVTVEREKSPDPDEP